MTIIIPVWLLWTFGIIGGLVILALAVVGVWFIFLLGSWENLRW